MAERGPVGGALGPEGLAGGPGPTPAGFDDGTPRPLEGAAPASPQEEGAPTHPAREAAWERAAHADPEEPDPS